MRYLVRGVGSHRSRPKPPRSTTTLVAAFARLIPQLSSLEPAAVGRRARSDRRATPSTSSSLARDADNDGRIVGSLTLVTFRIPTGLRAWIEDVVVDDEIRRSGAGRAPDARRRSTRPRALGVDDRRPHVAAVAARRPTPCT